MLIEQGKNFCEDCGKEIFKECIRCVACNSLNSRIVKDRPSLETLIEEVILYRYTGVGKKYNVSDTTIKSWIRKQGGTPMGNKEIWKIRKDRGIEISKLPIIK